MTMMKGRAWNLILASMLLSIAFPGWAQTPPTSTEAATAPTPAPIAPVAPTPFPSPAPSSNSVEGAVKERSELKVNPEEVKEIKEFESIKNVIRNDLLEEEVKKKTKKIIAKKVETKRQDLARYNYPAQDDFWTFMSEYWLVKNASKLNWDFEKVDYGLEESIKKVFESMGIYEKRMKLLLLKTPTVTHFALPANEGELIFLLSQPFIRTMDLTKLEMAILLLEDYYRHELGIFRDFVLEKEVKEKLGRNFYGEKPKIELLKKMLGNYDLMVFTKGFSFQQQYEVTQKMGNVLKSNMKLWGAYNGLLTKIDTLVKNNALYKDYNRIYPSPEFQLKWIRPPAVNP